MWEVLKSQWWTQDVWAAGAEKNTKGTTWILGIMNLWTGPMKSEEIGQLNTSVHWKKLSWDNWFVIENKHNTWLRITTKIKLQWPIYGFFFSHWNTHCGRGIVIRGNRLDQSAMEGCVVGLDPQKWINLLWPKFKMTEIQAQDQTVTLLMVKCVLCLMWWAPIYIWGRRRYSAG